MFELSRIGSGLSDPRTALVERKYPVLLSPVVVSCVVHSRVCRCVEADVRASEPSAYPQLLSATVGTAVHTGNLFRDPRESGRHGIQHTWRQGIRTVTGGQPCGTKGPRIALAALAACADNGRVVGSPR